MKTNPETILVGMRSGSRVAIVCLSLLLSAAMVGCGKKEDAREGDAGPGAEPQQAEVRKNSTENNVRKMIPASEGEVSQVVVEQDSADVTEAIEPQAAGDVPFVLKDLAQVKVHDGIEGPKVGDTIYTFQNLPKEACGTYWVMDSDGYVAMLAVCSGDHEH